MQIQEQDVTVYICALTITILILFFITHVFRFSVFSTFCIKAIALGLIVVVFFLNKKQIQSLSDFANIQKEQQQESSDIFRHTEMNLFYNYLFIAFLVVCVLYLIKSFF